MEDFFENSFSDGDHARAFIMVLVVLGISIGIWVGRTKLGVTIPLAIAVVLLAAVILPSWDPGRRVARQNQCLNNMRIIERAKANWTEARNRQPNEIPTMTDLFAAELEFKFAPVCPSGGTYSVGCVGEKPRCSWEGRGHKLD